MSQPKVSVIIPVYNAEAYLEQCLDSVESQTLRDIEIICVDDGSTDASLAILRQHAEKDGRVRILQQKNQYAGVARNNGMAAASGEYYIFLDADDFFESVLLETLYTRGQELNADMVLCGADQYDVSSGKFESMSWLLSEECFHAPVVSRETMANKIFQLTSLAPWNKLFSARFVKEHALQFQALPRANDAYFSMTALALAERIAAVDQVLVHYRVGMSTNLQAKNHLTPLAFCQALEAVKARLESEGLWPALRRSFAENALSQCSYNLKRLTANPSAYRVLAGALRGRYLDHFGVMEAINAGELDKAAAGELIDLLASPPFLPLQTAGLSLPASGGTPFVSVIIPVYNVEMYLAECLDSVINQTLQNIEIVCVNDGSPDGSAAILADYAQRDSRIRIVDRENGGLSAARNSGLDVARGEYLCFLDSDDALESDALELLYTTAEANRLDILYYDFVRFYDDGRLGKKFERRIPGLIYDGVTFCRSLKDRREYLGSACTQLYKRAFLERNGFRFYPGIIHEDEIFTFRALMEAERVSHFPRMFYRYRLREESIMTGGRSSKNVVGYCTCMREMLVYGLGSQHDTEKSAEILRAALAMQEKAKQYYGWIEPEEKVKLRFDDPLSMFLFQKLVLEMDAATLPTAAEGGQNAQVLALVNRTLTQELEEVRSSASYRIGRLITWVPRKIMGLVRCYRDHGIGYTFERIGAHFRREE